jgi:hypothetical protein
MPENGTGNGKKLMNFPHAPQIPNNARELKTTFLKPKILIIFKDAVSTAKKTHLNYEDRLVNAV